MQGAPKLTYFALPGRAEASRLMLSIGGIPFEDHRIKPADWAALKPTTPFRQVPILEHDGKVLAQSGAIERYCARLAGLMPTDPWTIAKNDEAAFAWQDVTDVLRPTMFLPDSEKAKARQELLDGALGDKLGMLSKLVEQLAGGFVSGDELSYGDLQLFTGLSYFKTGVIDGIPKDVLGKRWPALNTFHKKVATHPGVAAFYAKPENQDAGRAAYRAEF